MYANLSFKTTMIKQNTPVILIAGVPSSQALPGFLITAPPCVCVPDVIGALACGFQTQKKKTIDNNQRDAYDSRVCLYCPSGVASSEIHLILECPATSHVALDLIQFLTTLLYAPANQIGAP